MDKGAVIDIDVAITAECPFCNEVTIERLGEVPDELDVECSLCKEYYTITM